MNARTVAPRKQSSVEPAGRTLVGVVHPSAARRGREAASLLLFALAAFLSLALASAKFDPNDPSLTGSDWMGTVGAALAGVFIQGFGLVAWLAPIELSLIGLPLLKGQKHDALGLRIAGDLLVAIILSALLQVAVPEWQVFGRALSGGNVGLFFGELMRGLFSTLGSFLVGSTIVGLILIGRSSFSFIRWCKRIAEFAVRLWVSLDKSAKRLGRAWLEARQMRKAQVEAERAARAPRIDERPSDEAIIAQLADDDEWIPLETTGAPPLAISEALRQGFGGAEAAQLAETPLRQPEVRVAPSRASQPEPSDAQEPASSEPVAAEPVAPEPVAAELASPEAVASEQSQPPEVLMTELPAPIIPSAEAKPKSPRKTGASQASAAQPAPAKAKAAPESAEPPEPRIVDTKPEQQVERSRSINARRKVDNFELPSSDLLDAKAPSVADVDRDVLLKQAERLEKTLADYSVTAKVEEIHPGPTVTTYEVAPEAGTKVSKVANLSDDLALGLSRKVRIIAPIPGKSRIGFELPNDVRVPVNLRELIEDKRFEKLSEKAPLPVVLGRDIVGAPYYADLASMPHVIVAGATGAGKSVGLNVMLSSLLFRRTPEELRMLMIDPKVVELAPFDGIPHMLLPVVTDMKQASTALRWAVDEMERRYQLFADAGTKNITTYNNWVRRVHAGELPAPDPKSVEALSPEGAVVSVAPAKDGSDGVQLPGKLPYIVIVVDEFADLMMQQGKEVEASVARLAQKARAAGMHVVLATQRPSVDVITGMIKANFPTRIAFRVAQKVDSRTILDEQGAEVLLGRGDMLVKMNGAIDTRRVQCPFISEEEVSRLTDYLRAQGEPQYHDAILLAAEEKDEGGGDEEPVDARFDEAVQIVADTQRCSTSWLQRKMTIGYNRAAKIVEMMERRGMVGPPNGSKDREIYLSPI